MALWLAGPALVLVVHLAAIGAEPWKRMVLLVLALFLWMKAVVQVEAARRGTRLGAGDRLAFVLAWPGMRPRAFARRSPNSLPGARAILSRGVVRIAAGGALIALSHALVAAGGSRALATAPLLVGMSLLLHFGIFRLATALWRSRGRDVRELFRDPLRSRSLAEFWSRRWNVAFSEMVQETVYPLAVGRCGPALATGAGFLFSGLLHEAAITLPVRTGFGGPTLYFLLQWLGTLIERRLGPLGRIATLAWIAAPLPLLCPASFIREVCWRIGGL